MSDTFFGNPNWKSTLATLSLGAISGAVLSYSVNQFILPQKPVTPIKWVRVGKVKELILYPIKSCGSISVMEANATKIGLTANDFLRDRVFMVINERNVFQSQRVLPRMVLIKTNVRGDKLTVNAPGMEELTIPFPEPGKVKKRVCRVQDDRVREMWDCGDAIGNWLDSFLEQSGFRLVYHSALESQRERTPWQKKFPHFIPGDKGSLQDQTSFLIIAKESVDFINEKVDSNITHRNFRPNILIEGIPEPFAEDYWSYLKIGQNGPILKTAKPCTRCKLTTVDPDTGEFNNNGEPLKTLTEMERTFGNSKVDELCKSMGVIGLQMGLHQEGSTFKVGDTVYAAVL